MTDELVKLIQVWDGQGVYMKYDKPTDTWLFIALHNPTLGIMAGGCRMKVYPTPADGLRDAMRLGRGMTHKWAAIDFHYGGGKSVIALSRPIEGKEREALLRRFGRMLRSLNGAYSTGVDLGTSPEDMAIVREEGKYVFGGEGHEDPGPYTALGVFACIKTTARHALGSNDLTGVSVLIQGVGDVGEPLARMLTEAGATLILSDLDQARASKLAAELGGTTVDPDKVPDTECDILAPSAIGATLNSDTIPRLRCRADSAVTLSRRCRLGQQPTRGRCRRPTIARPWDLVRPGLHRERRRGNGVCALPRRQAERRRGQRQDKEDRGFPRSHSRRGEGAKRVPSARGNQAGGAGTGASLSRTV
jgi:leucine dehydrogenase